MPYTDELDLIALEHKEQCRKEALWKREQDAQSTDHRTHDPPGSELFIATNIDLPHFEEDIDEPFYEEPCIIYD